MIFSFLFLFSVHFFLSIFSYVDDYWSLQTNIFIFLFWCLILIWIFSRNINRAQWLLFYSNVLGRKLEKYFRFAFGLPIYQHMKHVIRFQVQNCFRSLFLLWTKFFILVLIFSFLSLLTSEMLCCSSFYCNFFLPTFRPDSVCVNTLYMFIGKCFWIVMVMHIMILI